MTIGTSRRIIGEVGVSLRVKKCVSAQANEQPGQRPQQHVDCDPRIQDDLMWIVTILSTGRPLFVKSRSYKAFNRKVRKACAKFPISRGKSFTARIAKPA